MPPQITDARALDANRSVVAGRIALVGLAVAALVLLTVAVEMDAWPVRLDHWITGLLPAPGAGGLDGVLMASAWIVATLATPAVTVALTLVAGAWWSWGEQSTAPLRSVLPPVMVMTIAVVTGKALLHRAGPPGSKTPHLLGYYPSGHTATALVCTATLAVLAGQRHPGWATRLRVASACWTVLVAIAMVFHRYHWLTDVVAAGLLGAVIVMSFPHRPVSTSGQPACRG